MELELEPLGETRFLCFRCVTDQGWWPFGGTFSSTTSVTVRELPPAHLTWYLDTEGALQSCLGNPSAPATLIIHVYLTYLGTLRLIEQGRQRRRKLCMLAATTLAGACALLMSMMGLRLRLELELFLMLNLLLLLLLLRFESARTIPRPRCDVVRCDDSTVKGCRCECGPARRGIADTYTSANEGQ
ncbi:hypothetical protein Cob_v005425 [Colletotrichum orbiculare MAFF 240422]|uniref:Uncharacterized protein n=1 Tax=Colletotrichum orbiculare (strain 104-T / ATCC 96160 / CBS 514.97 / LARS 414 / MAFF 240422) TaxID=1213857 RepID=A0A484FUM7_COLOR|nr:hypothetical protein Cob_v005425 [Colletotrichum orbiculare MAFF 240422]